jgi:hypothetical protein
MDPDSSLEKRGERMPDGLEAQTDTMLAFAGQLQNPPGNVPTDLPAGAGAAGMAESAGLRTAMVHALMAADSFIGDVDQGFNSFKALAIECHDDYEQNDARNAASIAATAHAAEGLDARLARLEVDEEARELRHDRMGI